MYYENQYIITYLATVGGIDDTQTTGIKLQSVAGVLTDRPGILIVDYADPLDEARCEWISYTSIDVNQELVGATRGVEKGSAKIHSQNAVIAFPHSKSNNNQFADIFHPAATTTIAENLLLKETAAAPTTPSAGYKKIYFDTDDKLYTVDDAGAAKQVLQTGDVTPFPTDGWTDVSDTWVYASASTFTIAGVDRTAIYTKGTRLRFKQGGGYKYAVVLSSSFSTNTTVTIAVNTDYTIANAAITDNDYSYAAGPAGYPGWFAFTPTWAGFSANPGGTCKYNIVGNLVTYSLYGGVGTSNSTSFTVTLPVPIASYYVGAFCVGSQIGVDNGASVIAYATCGSTTRLDFYKTLALGGWTGSGNKGIQLIIPFELN